MLQDGQINPANDGLRKSAHVVKATRRLKLSPRKNDQRVRSPLYDT